MTGAEERAGAGMIFWKAGIGGEAEAGIICRERTTGAAGARAGTATACSRMIRQGGTAAADAAGTTDKII
jgi:hypothetical protein